MIPLWTPADRPDTTSYSPLWCAQGERHLHVAVEGPHREPPHLVPGELPKLSHIEILGDTGWTPQDGFGSSGPANLRYLSSKRYLHTGFYEPPPADVTRLEISFVDPEERPLFSAAYTRQTRAEPSGPTWKTREPLPDGFRLLGAGCGQDVFYAYCEGPWKPAAEPVRPPSSPGIEWDYVLRFPDDLPQPRPDTVHLLHRGTPQLATRATLMFRVPRAGRDPHAFEVRVTEPGTDRTIFHLEAYRD